MPARHKIDQLPDDQLKFVLDHIIDGETDREICFAFEDQFKAKLTKSSLARWRKAAGDELADRYRMTRYQAKQLIEDLKLDPESDKYAVVMAQIEDRLLTATREVVSQDPFKLIIVQQEEKRRKLQSQKLALDERKQAFAEEQAKKSEQLEKDRFEIAAETWRFILAFVKSKAPTAVDQLTALSPELLTELETFISQQA